MGVPKTSDHIWIKIKMPNLTQEPLTSSTAPNDVLCTFKIKIESQNLDHRYIKDHWHYPNHDQYPKHQSGSSSILQSPKTGLKEHGCSLHLQHKDREPNFGTYVYQTPLTITKSRSRCHTPIRDLQRPLKLRIRTLRTRMFFAPSKFRYRAKILKMDIQKTHDHIQIKIKMPTPVRNLQGPPKPQMRT